MSIFYRSKWLLKLLRIFSFLRYYWNKFRSNTLTLKDSFSEFHAEMWHTAADKLSVELVSYSGGFHKASYGDGSTWIQDYQVQCDHHVMLELARNKPLVNTLLANQSIPVPLFHAFTLKDIASAGEFLNSQNTPCVVKPALRSAGGQGVTTNVKTNRGLVRAAIFASVFSPLVMIERQVPGDVYRLLYLDGDLIDVIRRRPPHVIGDGHSTIRRLIQAENRRRIEQSGHSALKVLLIDIDCRKSLRRAGLSLKSVPERDRVVDVKSTTNESAAKECETIRTLISDELVQEGAHAAEVLGIRLAGIDVITHDVGISLKQSGGMIIEVNVSPGLHYHYHVRNPEDSIPVAIPILRRLLDIKEKIEKT